MTKYNEHNLTPDVISEMIAFEKEVDYSFGDYPTLRDGNVEVTPKGSVKVKNTARHQFVALTIFANSLGYVQNEDEVAEGKLGSCFHYLGGKTKRKVVGFNTMCTWYNTCFMLRFNHGIAQELSTQADCLEMDVALLVNAINTRLYKQVYMQATKDGRVVVQKHILDFV